MYKEQDIKDIIQAADIRNYIPDLKGTGAHKWAICPFCGESRKRKGLTTYTPKDCKNEIAAFCHSCNQGFSNAISAVQHYEEMSFPEAVKYVSEKEGIYLISIEEDEKTRRELQKKQKPKKAKNVIESFCSKQLAASGLTVEDVTAIVHDKEGNEIHVPTFVKGGYDTKTWTYNFNDDEMLIFYYSLEGELVKYAARGIAGRAKDYVRVRWSNPDIHRNIKGKEMKYQTPPNASAKLYFPQMIRTSYKNASPIDVLIIQEGEKKAEKACKHGIPSVAIQGIQNIGNKDTGVIQELQYLVQRCSIKKVVLLFDSDWNELSHSLSANDAVDARPKSFSGAAKKFRNYIESMQNVNVSVDVYFGHIKKNEADEKGIDDLLCGSLAGKEDSLWPDIQKAILAHNGEGDFVNIHKISTLSDYQIDEFWSLRSPEKFYELHKEKLDSIVRFRINRIVYVVEDGNLKVATKYESDKELWNIEYDKNDKKIVSFSNIEMLKFIAANGFYRCHTADCKDDGFRYIHIEDNIISYSGINEIRDFVWNYLQDNCKDIDVKENYLARVAYILSESKLALLKMVSDNFEKFSPTTQRCFFENGCVSITADGMELEENHPIVWNDKIIKRPFSRTQVIKEIVVDKVNDTYKVILTEEGKKCEFLQYLVNTCNFWEGQDSIGPKEERVMHHHLVNKITSIGYLLNDYKFASEQKAVVAMDAAMSDIGQSNGRSGKSLVGMAIEKILEQNYISGRETKNEEEYLYSGVTPRTRNIFFDDVKVNFDFERFYNVLTGDMNVNPKYGNRFTLKNEVSPKFYITTNHAINIAGGSSKDRIMYMSFSDYYNDAHKPIDDFGHNFFADWDEEQWSLFDNFMLECNMYYLRSYAEGWARTGQGAVPPPMEDIEQRTYMQMMGSAFFQWAEAYFDKDAGNINRRLIRKDLFNAYHYEFPEPKYGVTANNFRAKLEIFCKFKKYDLNARKPNKRGVSLFDFVKVNTKDIFIGANDKSGGVEYLTVSDREYSLNGLL